MPDPMAIDDYLCEAEQCIEKATGLMQKARELQPPRERRAGPYSWLGQALYRAGDLQRLLQRRAL